MIDTTTGGAMPPAMPPAQPMGAPDGVMAGTQTGMPAEPPMGPPDGVKPDQDGTTTPKRKSAFDLGAAHKALDKDGDKKISAKELGVSEADYKQIDQNGNGDISKGEFRKHFQQRNSFKALDGDGDGKLSADEMGKLQRFDDRPYDADGDGAVSQQEFVAARKAEMVDNRRARIQERITAAQGEDLEKLVSKFDANQDGQVTAGEVLDGRRAKREEKRHKQDMETFQAMAGEGGEMSLGDEANKNYGAYDGNQDGMVSEQEFMAGRRMDRMKMNEARLTGEPVDTGLEARMKKPAMGGPVDVGNLKDLTYEKAIALVKAQGGELPKDGKPTVLAIRTENAGTKTYDDHFVVLKANGEMKVFAGSTRPGFTTPSGGWDPGMLVAGNYEITPRWRDGKFNNDAFIVGNEEGGMTVRTAMDRNGDGRYSKEEIENAEASDEIRLHRGNATTTSSAGCLNVQDYDGFLAFLGGRDTSFDLTLVEG